MIVRLLIDPIGAAIRGYDIVLDVNFENEILLRRGGCEDSQIYLF